MLRSTALGSKIESNSGNAGILTSLVKSYSLHFPLKSKEKMQNVMSSIRPQAQTLHSGKGKRINDAVKKASNKNSSANIINEQEDAACKPLSG